MNKPATERVRAFRTRLNRGGVHRAYTAFYHDLQPILPDERTAFFYCDLLDRMDMISGNLEVQLASGEKVDTENVDDDGYMRMTRSFLQWPGRWVWTADKQKGHLNKLKAAGLVEVVIRRKGQRKTRWVRIPDGTETSHQDGGDVSDGGSSHREVAVSDGGSTPHKPTQDSKPTTMSGSGGGSARSARSTRPERGRSRDEPHPKEAPMPLLPPPPSATAPAPEDVNRATALLSALRAKNLAMRRVVVSKWADEFRLLRQAYKPQQIDATLNWYCSHVAGEWVPQAFSAAGFRAKFDEITAAATRGRKYDALPDPSPLAKKIAAEAELWGGWPGDSASQLPAAAQLCHDGVKSVRAKLRNYVVVHDGADDNRREDEKRIALAKEMLARLPDHTEYPREFLRRLHKRVTNWPGFDGNVLSPNLRFDPDGKDFQALCRAKCNDYCHEPERWDALWAEVNK